MEEDIEFIFSAEKNTKLLEQRGVGFTEVIWGIDNGYVLDIVPHHNQRQYPGQKIVVVEINDYAYLVPFVQSGNVVELKTVIPSRKATKKYLRCEVKHGD